MLVRKIMQNNTKINKQDAREENEILKTDESFPKIPSC